MAQAEQAAVQAVEAYLSDLQRHDLEAASEHLADDVVMTFAGADIAMNKEQIISALGWDVGAKGRFSFELLSASDDTVTIALTETNDFLDLLELPPIEAEMTFAVNENARIQSIVYKQTGAARADPETVQRALAPAVSWAEQHAPETLAEIYPQGRIQYSRESAEKWVERLTGAEPERIHDDVEDVILLHHAAEQIGARA